MKITSRKIERMQQGGQMFNNFNQIFNNTPNMFNNQQTSLQPNLQANVGQQSPIFQQFMQSQELRPEIVAERDRQRLLEKQMQNEKGQALVDTAGVFGEQLGKSGIFQALKNRIQQNRADRKENKTQEKTATPTDSKPSSKSELLGNINNVSNNIRKQTGLDIDIEEQMKKNLNQYK